MSTGQVPLDRQALDACFLGPYGENDTLLEKLVIEFLREVYPGLQRSYDYWWANMLAGDAVFTGGAMGMDNVPRGGPGTAQADAVATMSANATAARSPLQRPMMISTPTALPSKTSNGDSRSRPTTT